MESIIYFSSRLIFVIAYLCSAIVFYLVFDARDCSFTKEYLQVIEGLWQK